MRGLIFDISLILVLCLGSCKDLGDSDPDVVWVGRFYSGGFQCDTSSHYTPPDIARILRSENIPVLGSHVEMYGTCRACGCPAYAAMHYALILKRDLARAEQMGFQQKAPPRPAVFTLGQEFDLKYGQSAVLSEAGMTLTFKALSEDSRCPEGAVCIWAGNARVLLSVSDSDVSLNTTLEPKVVTVDAFQIRLVTVNPYPKISVERKPEEYSVRLIVTRE